MHVFPFIVGIVLAVVAIMTLIAWLIHEERMYRAEHCSHTALDTDRVTP